MDVKATYKNKLNVLKTFITMMVVTVFLAFNGIRSEAKVIQTQEGDDQVTVTWDDKTNTDYAIGYAKVEGDVTDAMHTAKAMAAGRSIVLPSTQKSYTITGLSVNSQYVVYLLRKTGSKNTGSDDYVFNSYVCTKLTNITNLRQTEWYKGIKEVNVEWDKVPGEFYQVDYEVRFMNEKGKVIETKVLKANKYSHSVDNKKIYKIQVRAIRSPKDGISTVPKTSTPWTDAEYLIPQPVVKSAKIKDGKMTIKWDKIPGATNYKIYVSTDKNKGYKKVGSVKGKKNKFTVKKLKKKKFKKSKTYYIYVTANKKVNGKIIKKGVSYVYEVRNGKVSEKSTQFPF